MRRCKLRLYLTYCCTRATTAQATRIMKNTFDTVLFAHHPVHELFPSDTSAKRAEEANYECAFGANEGAPSSTRYPPAAHRSQSTATKLRGLFAGGSAVQHVVDCQQSIDNAGTRTYRTSRTAK